MNKMLLFLAACWVSCATALVPENKLIVVLIDGCRWDYIKDPQLKGIPQIVREGVRAPFVNPVYPSLSYPNWYSIVTGLYPESHGFVNNQMYDSDSEAFFLMLPDPNSTDAHWWNEAEPIWVTAEKRGIRTGLYWWAGCEVEIKGMHPTICERHRYGPGTEDEKADFLERIDDLVEMFRSSRGHGSQMNAENGISAAFMYYGPVDYTGHYSGPESSERERALRDIDEILAKMQEKLQVAGLKDKVNIMVVSDHGMTDIREPNTKVMDLEQFSSKIKYQVSSGASSMIVPLPDMLDILYNEMKSADLPGIRVYKKEDIPLKYHLKGNKKVAPLFLQAKKGYYIKPLEDKEKRVGDRYSPYIGTHGYDPEEVEDMRTIFFASGPSFRKGATTKNLTNVDFYNVMCHVLGMEPLNNNGSWEHVQDMFEGSNPSPNQSSRGSVTLISNTIGGIIILIWCSLTFFATFHMI